MPRVGYRTRIYYNEINKMYLPRGEGDTISRRIGKDILKQARMRVPKRSRVLANSHRLERARSNQYMARHVVYANADHALWVHEGTRPVITPRNANLLVLRPAYGGHPVNWQPAVRGQQPQRWLSEAGAEIGRRYIKRRGYGALIL